MLDVLKANGGGEWLCGLACCNATVWQNLSRILCLIFSLVYLGLRSSLLLHPPSRIKVCDAAHLPAISTEPTLMPNESTESYVWVTQVTSRNHESNCVWQNNMAWHQSHVDYGNCPAGANSGVCGSLVTVAIVTSIFIALCFLRDGSIAYRRAQLKATKHLATDTLSFVGCTFLFLELLFTFVCAGVWLISSYLLSSGLSTILKMIDYPNCSGTTRCYSWSDGRCCIQRKYIDVVVWSQTHVYRSRTSSAPSIAWSTGVLLVLHVLVMLWRIVTVYRKSRSESRLRSVKYSELSQMDDPL